MYNENYMTRCKRCNVNDFPESELDAVSLIIRQLVQRIFFYVCGKKNHLLTLKRFQINMNNTINTFEY